MTSFVTKGGPWRGNPGAPPELAIEQIRKAAIIPRDHRNPSSRVAILTIVALGVILIGLSPTD